MTLGCLLEAKCPTSLLDPGEETRYKKQQKSHFIEFHKDFPTHMCPKEKEEYKMLCKVWLQMYA